MARWPDGSIWIGKATDGRLKACIHCQGVYADAFYVFTRTQSTISWATGNEGGMYLTSARGHLFSIVSGYWGALVCACHEQEMCLHSPRSSILSLMNGESWDRVSGTIKTLCEKWMLRPNIKHTNIVLQLPSRPEPIASWPVHAGQGGWKRRFR